MKKLVKILPILMTVMMILMAISPVFADFRPSNVKPDTRTSAAAQVSNVGNSIVGIIQVGGTIAAVGILMVVGIKYMMGSAEQKAEYKKVMLPYIIGAVLLFAAVQIAGVIYNAKDAFLGS